MNYRVIPMDRSHLKQIAALEQACFSTPWSEAVLEEVLFNDTASYLVAEDERGVILGYAGLHVVLDEGYITNVAVLPEYRRRGVARRLVDVFCRFGTAHLAFLTLEVRPSNKEALALYKRFGFREEGRRKHYYTKPQEDAVIMTRYFKEEERE